MEHNEQLARETLQELTKFQRDFDRITSLLERVDDPQDFADEFAYRFIENNDYDLLLSKAKGVITGLLIALEEKS